jgi:hypothetical protein
VKCKKASFDRSTFLHGKICTFLIEPERFTNMIRRNRFFVAIRGSLAVTIFAQYLIWHYLANIGAPAENQTLLYDCSFNAVVHGLEERLHLPYEGRQSADDGRHGGGARAASYEAEELFGPAGAGRSKLRGGALHRIYQELATHR